MVGDAGAPDTPAVAHVRVAAETRATVPEEHENVEDPGPIVGRRCSVPDRAVRAGHACTPTERTGGGAP